MRKSTPFLSMCSTYVFSILFKHQSNQNRQISKVGIEKIFVKSRKYCDLVYNLCTVKVYNKVVAIESLVRS